MFIGSIWLDISIPEANSLKDKRRVVRSIKDRLRANYNIAIAEIGANDIWRRAELGVACVGNDKNRLHRQMAKIVDKIRADYSVMLIDYQTEII